MKSKSIRKLVIVGIICLFFGTITIPSITSVDSEMQDSYCQISRPIRALYLNDDEIWQFKFIQRAVVLGDITLEVDAIDDVSGIEYVEIFVDGQRKATVYSPPYQFLWDEWRPGFHIIDARAHTNNGTFLNAESFQILKFG